jgi:hypothetical protein
MKSATFDSMTWPEGIIQLLDDHHLVVLSDHAKTRRQFGTELAENLSLIADTQVIEVEGSGVVDLPSFCRQLEQKLTIPTILPNPWWRDMQSVINALRGACAGSKRRYFIWHGADALLEADVHLFGRVVNAFFGVAAECEHISLEPLVLLRVVFIGGAKLGAYAEDTSGQFCKWIEEEDSPFWEVINVIDRPPVITYRVDG